MEVLQDSFRLLGVSRYCLMTKSQQANAVHGQQQRLKLPVNFFPFPLFGNVLQMLQTLGEPRKNVFRARLGGQDSASLSGLFPAMLRLSLQAVPEPLEWRMHPYGYWRASGVTPCSRKVP